MADSTKLLPNEFAVEFDGPDMHPPNVDGLRVLEFATAYFGLLSALATLDGEPVQLVGLRVVDKCTALASCPSSIDTMIAAAASASSILETFEPPPHGTRAFVTALRSAREELGTEVTINVLSQGWSAPIVVSPKAQLPTISSSLCVRARPFRVGGKTPAVWFESASEEGAFKLGVSEADARRIANHLYSVT